ncbi:hypothetical protein M422DRAFT_44585 [Sphaerobolus stellatus SS14]|nr:hypothetical protein M422DRAFT_44585 [Sphaerobolus stellatus SS14]
MPYPSESTYIFSTADVSDFAQNLTPMGSAAPASSSSEKPKPRILAVDSEDHMEDTIDRLCKGAHSMVEKARYDCHMANRRSAKKKYRKEVKILQAEVELLCETSKLISNEALGELLPALECGICKNTLEQPYALPCGHVYCGSCIHKWMTPSHEEVPGGGREQSWKSCLQCCSLIRPAPVPAFMLKDILLHLAHKGIILPQRESRYNFTDLVAHNL